MRGLVDEMDHQVSVIATPTCTRSTRSTRRGSCVAARPCARCSTGAGRRRTRAASAGRSASTARPRWPPRRGCPSEEYWEQIIARLLPGRRGPDRALARGRRAPRSARASGSTRWRSSACTSIGEDVDLRVSARRAAPLGRRERAQHPELRDLHEPGLARHRGLDPLQPAALPLRQPRQGHPPGVRAAGASSRRPPRRTSACCTEMVATENADSVGEFSLTDRRFSRITRFMAADAVRRERRRRRSATPTSRSGESYQDAYDGRPGRGLERATGSGSGSTSSSVHTDIVSTTERTVTATLRGR